jgi:translation initiation factor 1A
LQKRYPEGSEEIEGFRVRLPRGGEMFGTVEALHGAKHMTVKCADGKRRMARVPGKLKKIWVREGDYVIIIPWEIESDKKCDIVWRYKRAEMDFMRRKGLVKDV